MHQAVRIPFCASEQLAFLGSKPKLNKTRDGDVTVAIYCQFAFESVTMAAVRGSGIGSNSRSETVAASGKLLGQVEHLSPRLKGTFLLPAIMARPECAD